MTDLELFLKIKVVDGRRDVEGLTRIAFHVIGHGAGLVDDQQALAGCSGVIPDMVTRILQRLFDELNLIADRLAERLCRAGAHDLLMAEEGVRTIVHQLGTAERCIRRKRQAGELPPHDVRQTKACQIGQLQVRRALKDMHAGVGTAVRRAHLRHIRHCAHTKTIQNDYNKLSHCELSFLSFPDRFSQRRVQARQLRLAGGQPFDHCHPAPGHKELCPERHDRRS